MTRQKRNLCHLLSFGILGLLLISLGCQSGPKPVTEPCPKWAQSIPRDQTYFYARGTSGPTPMPVDAWDQATERARKGLALTIISHVRVDTTISSSSRGQYVEEIVRILSDTELNYSQAIEMWYDRYGICGHEGHYYVLVRMERRNAETVLGRAKHPGPEEGT